MSWGKWQREREREKERERERVLSRLKAQYGAWCGAQSHDPGVISEPKSRVGCSTNWAIQVPRLHSILSVIFSQTQNLIVFLACLKPFRGRPLPAQPVSQGIRTLIHSHGSRSPRKWNSPSIWLAVICGCHILSAASTGTSALTHEGAFLYPVRESPQVGGGPLVCVSSLKPLLTAPLPQAPLAP